MTSRKLSQVLGFIFTLFFATTSHSQSQYAIVFNEYSATNVNGTSGSVADVYGHTSDWVELYCNYDFSVSLASYYLSNDRSNLFKWQFPADYVLDAKTYGVVWLSGKSGPKGVKKLNETHANFTLEQCRGQWLILSTNTGVVRDSIFVRPAKAGHTWGRVDYLTMGVNAWKLFTQPSQLQPNPLNFSVRGYAPTPKIFLSTTTVTTGTKGGFYEGPQIVYFKLSDTGPAFDTATSCYRIYYTLDGSYPDTSNTNTTTFYPDSLAYFTIDVTTVVRAIAVPQTSTLCPTGFLDSFCETNTYFIDAEYQTFDENFGIISVAREPTDTGWFNLSAPPPTTVHVEYYDKKKQVSEGYASFVKPFNEKWVTLQRGFQLTIDDEQGFGCNFEGNIFNVEGLGTSSRTVFPTLHVSGGDYEAHSPVGQVGGESYGTGIRDVFYQSLAAKNNLHVNPLHVKPAITFFNGIYMGVYTLKEVYDRYYESYYNKQPLDSVELDFMHGLEGNIVDYEGVPSTAGFNFRQEIYDPVMLQPMNSKTNYDKVMAKLDKASFIDYMILNSFGVNSDNFNYNVAFARGADHSNSGALWHYYLWNTPAIFSFTDVPGNTQGLAGNGISPCELYQRPYVTATKLAYNGHGNILKKLMTTVDNGGQGCGRFQLEFRNRYQDLLNGPLNCDNLVKHLAYIRELYGKEYKYHENPSSAPKPGAFYTATADRWDTLTERLSNTVSNRCYVVQNWFGKAGCFGATGPYQITINVKPDGAGKVKLNSTVLDNYPWTGHYYSTTLPMKAIPASTVYAFNHWEFENHTPTLPASMDSVAIQFYTNENAVAVFTDKSKDITSGGDEPNIPTAFTPNGDGYNDDFRILGAGEYLQNYQMTIWSRWGQEVFRSTDPRQGWDGNFKGSPAITGVYAYLITYKNIYGESKTVKGNVTLTR